MKIKTLCWMGLVILLSSCASTRSDIGVNQENSKQNLANIKTQLAVELLKVRDYQAAVDTINQVLKLRPSDAHAWMTKGIIHQTIKDYATANTAYIKALALSPHNAEVNNNYGWFVCDLMHDPQRSLNYFDRALTNLTYSTPELAQLNKGICLARLHRYTEAKTALRQSLVLNPKFPYALAELSRLEYLRTHYSAAEAYFAEYEKLVERLRPQDLDLVIQIKTKLGRLQERKEYLKILKKDYPLSEESMRLGG
ncbi:MAG: type IV pilus biogenesis/stability protein PilW [Neisseriaceae bacterium]